jgi:hypothetical protein
MPDRSLREYAQTTNLFESKPIGYLEIYEKYFAPLMDKEVKLLELGVATGQSMLMWRDYFVNGTIAGVDLFPLYQPEASESRVRIFQGAQNNTRLLTTIAQEIAPDGFDIIIDDCSHIGELAKISFWHLFTNHLKPGGVYAIEDWGTGYLGGYRNVYYPDGEFFDPTERETILHWLATKMLKSAPVEWQENSWLQKRLKRYQYTRRFKGHDYGMVGFVKQLIDEVGAGDYTSQGGVSKPKNPPEPQRPPRFAHVLYAPGVVVVTKAF